ncbi:hypothetical protein BT96DRAFT_951080 [Gymnopus androsaceus JB14]|uniref:Uncharacterized protein n=1 Tax=Gymnopus androsaceus JB14 TaxID=1447944 RepID=A0A6A4GE74_9AGAR|nr:hypothetical protein BT96DRAFT_951080 [Gymnopus androsaceus JB14]
MSNAEPSNTPPPQYTPAPAAVPATRRKKGEATDIHPHIVDKIKLKYIEEFEMKVKKHDPKFTGSKVIDTWRKTTSEAILELIKSGTPPFQNIALTEGQRKNNLNAINRIFQNHYHHKLKKANPRGGIVVSHEDAIKIVECVRELRAANTGREFFKLQLADDIQQRVNSGENYQTVVKAMWDELTEEKRNQWNKEAKQVDIAGWVNFFFFFFWRCSYKSLII